MRYNFTIIYKTISNALFKICANNNLQENELARSEYLSLFGDITVIARYEFIATVLRFFDKVLNLFIPSNSRSIGYGFAIKGKTIEKLKVIIPSKATDMKDIARSHMKAFPNSLSTKLGLKYCSKMLEWYLVSQNRFLFHMEVENKIIGYCGGFIRREEQHGSSTGMTQHAFNAGIRAFFFRPWLLFHPKVIKNSLFIIRNVKLRTQEKSKAAPTKQVSTLPTEIIAGLVVIGVDPDYQGKSYGSKLLQEFERIAQSKGVNKIILSVKSDNDKAIKSYTQNGWLSGAITQDSLHMYKEI